MIHHTASGAGNPVVLLHGFCETSEIWSEWSKNLSQTHQVIVPDLPGFGESPLPLGATTLEDIADQISAFLSDQKIDKCFVAGHSLGGYVALALARKYPDLLTGLGLVHSTTFADNDEKKRNREKGIDHVNTHGMQAFSASFVPHLFYAQNLPKFRKEIESLKKIAADTPVETFEVYSRAMKNRQDSMHVWQEFEKPVFIIAGKEDSAVPFSQSAEMIKNIRKGNFLVLDEAAHMGFIEQKEACLTFVRTFFDQYGL
jgi:pimeloyl-ACP methyl ester carboxylesterase